MCVCVREWGRYKKKMCVCVCVNKYCEKGSGLNPRGTVENHTCLNISLWAMELCILHSDHLASSCLFVERIPGGHLVWCCLGLQEAVAWIFYRAAAMHFWWLLAQFLPSLFHRADDCTYSVPFYFLTLGLVKRLSLMSVHQNAVLKCSKSHGIKQQRSL